MDAGERVYMLGEGAGHLHHLDPAGRLVRTEPSTVDSWLTGTPPLTAYASRPEHSSVPPDGEVTTAAVTRRGIPAIGFTENTRAQPR